MTIKRYARNIGRLLALGALVLITTASLSAREAAGPSGSAATITPQQNAASVAARKPHIWTAEEMRAAKPYPIKELKVAPNQGRGGPPSAGKPGAVPGQLALDEKAAAEADMVEVVASENPSPMGYSYPFPYTRYSVFTAYTGSPYRRIGKLFFKQYGASYQCSAAAQGNRGVITAGHCIHAGNNDPNGWSTDVVFVPAYKDGSAPYGQWACDYFTEITFTAWYSSGQFNRDVGGCKTLLNGSGQKLSQVVGALGFSWNYSADQHWHAFGYPAEAPFTGGRLIVCTASRAVWDMTNVSPATQGIGCDMNRGSSGGPWVRSFSSSGGYINGVNSYKYFSSQPGAMYSPYFDDAVKTGIYDSITAP